jgi:hypothetical protein
LFFYFPRFKTKILITYFIKIRRGFADTPRRRLNAVFMDFSPTVIAAALSFLAVFKGVFYGFLPFFLPFF